MQVLRRITLAAVSLHWHLSSCLGATIPPAPSVTPSVQRNATDLNKRASAVTQLSTCGYLNGDPSKSWTADKGYNCRIDAANGLWGFCTTTVFSASDCGFNGVCVDGAQCKDGCGSPNKKMGTATCSNEEQCTTALLNFGVDQTYSYVGCGPENKIITYFATPTVDNNPTTRTKDSKQPEQPSLTSGPDSSMPEQSSSTSVIPASATNPPSAGAVTENTSLGDKPNMTGPIIGGVIGGLALLCVSAVTAIYLLRRNRAEPPPAYTPSVDSREKRAPKRKTLSWSPPQELHASSVRPPSRYELQG